MWISHIRDVWKLAACMLGSVVYKRVSNVFCTIRVRLRNSQCLLRSGREIGKAALPLQQRDCFHPCGLSSAVRTAHQDDLSKQGAHKIIHLSDFCAWVVYTEAK